MTWICVDLSSIEALEIDANEILFEIQNLPLNKNAFQNTVYKIPAFFTALHVVIFPQLTGS